MSNIFTYIVNLRDQMSAPLVKINAGAEKVKKQLDSVNNAASSLGGVLKTLGFGFGIFQVASMMKEGAEKAHSLHAAQNQLANTMRNMGVYSEEAYTKAIKGAGDMSKGILYGKAELIELQSRLRMVGNVGEKEMDRMAMASADMATKFGTGIIEAGDSIAKAVNNPEMMRRLAMQLKIDPNTVDRIQKIAKAGKEAKARLMLIDVVEKKVGGAAKAAFDANPLARFNKTMGSIKTQLGEVYIKIQKALAPLMIVLAELFKRVATFATDAFGGLFKKLKEGDPVLTGIVIALGAFAAVMGVVALATKAWAVAQGILNVVMSLNPVGLVIAAIVALIALIAFLIIKIDGWGETWDNVVTFCELAFESFKTSLELKWLQIQDFFLKGIELIETGWYKLQGLWDSEKANAGLAKLEAERNARAKEMADTESKLKELSDKMSEMEVIKLRVNDTSLKDVASGIMSKLGISTAGIPGMAGAETDGTGDGVGTNGGETGSTANNITTGGSKTTYITLKIGEMGNNMTVIANGIREGAEKVRDIVLDELTRALLTAQANL